MGTGERGSVGHAVASRPGDVVVAGGTVNDARRAGTPRQQQAREHESDDQHTDQRQRRGAFKSKAHTPST